MTNLESNLNGINGIPFEIFKEHQEVLEFWRACQLERVALLHIDAHADMANYIPPKWHNPNNRGIDSFICRAVYEKIVSSVFWLNPHLLKNQVRYWEVSGKTKKKPDGQIRWRGLPEGTILKKSDVQMSNPYILDIDLDAFCCHRPVELAELSYRGVTDFEKRIDRTIQFLQRFAIQPVAIDIARSQRGTDQKYCFVPPEKVDDVQRYFVDKLVELYVARQK